MSHPSVLCLFPLHPVIFSSSPVSFICPPRRLAAPIGSYHAPSRLNKFMTAGSDCPEPVLANFNIKRRDARERACQERRYFGGTLARCYKSVICIINNSLRSFQSCRNVNLRSCGSLKTRNVWRGKRTLRHSRGSHVSCIPYLFCFLFIVRLHDSRLHDTRRGNKHRDMT